VPTGLTSPAHLGVVLVVALVVLGPDRLPAALRQVAHFVRAVRRIVDDMNQTVAAAAVRDVVDVEPAQEVGT